MRHIAVIGLLSATLAGGLPQPASAHVDVAVGIGAPGFGAVITTGPVFAPYAYPVYGAPVYYGPPVIYPRAPQRWYGGGKHHRHHKRFKHGRHCD